MSSVGIFIDHMNVFLCNSFQAKVLNDQLCYEVDLNRISNKDNIENELKTGFVFIMDYNEDRQVTFDDQDTLLLEPDIGLASRIIQEDENKHAVIYLDTIGTDYKIRNCRILNVSKDCISEPVKLIGEGQYNLNDLKEIKVTDSYLGLDHDVRGCQQTNEPVLNCKTRKYMRSLLKKCYCLPFNMRNLHQNVCS